MTLLKAMIMAPMVATQVGVEAVATDSSLQEVTKIIRAKISLVKPLNKWVSSLPSIRVALIAGTHTAWDMVTQTQTSPRAVIRILGVAVRHL